MDNKDNNPHLGENTALPIDGCQKELDDLGSKELPQEIVNEIDREAREFIKEGYEDHQCGKVFEKQIINSNVKNYTTGAQIAHSHYIKELQAKDTTIKEQAEKIEKLTAAFREYYLCFRTQQDVSRFEAPDERKYLKELKEQHGI